MLPFIVVAAPDSVMVERPKSEMQALFDREIRMLHYNTFSVLVCTSMTRKTNSFEVLVDNILVAEILETFCNIKCLEKQTQSK